MPVHRRSWQVLALCVASVCSARHALAEPRLSTPVTIFAAGTTYPNYRIPSLVSAPDGSLLAIAEGRTYDDPGIGTSDLDIVARRSTDGGLTWSAMSVIDTWAGGSSSNPTSVVDRDTGRIFVFFNRWEGFKGTTDSLPGTTNNTAWVRHSDDNGQTWSEPRDITASVKDFNNWNTVSYGPGSGIQASNGRLIIPSARWVNGWQPYAVYSNDHGNTWTRGALVPGGNLAGENQIVQLANGSILLEARPNTGTGQRVDATSANGGLTWSSFVNGQAGPDSQTAIERYTLASAGADQNRILFTGPKASPREDLVIRTSYDEAQSWINERLLYDGYSGYSDITILPDHSVGVLFETNEARSVTFLKLTREWIEPPQRLKAYEGFRYNSPTLGTKNGGLLWSSGWSGSVDLTAAPSVKVEASDLGYANFPFAVEGNGRVFFDNGGTIARPLPENISLNGATPYYISALIRQDDVGTDSDTSSEALDISLHTGTTKILSFGVRGNESFYYDLPGVSGATAADTLAKGVPYYLVAKIVPQDNSDPANRDRIYVKFFQSGELVPASEDLMGWTLAGVSGSNSSSVLDRIVVRGGTLADWVFDELRLGTSFGAVVSNALQYRWNVDAAGNWSQTGNWLDGVPNASTRIAQFGSVITAPRTINLDQPQVAGGLTFDSSVEYTIAGTATLSLDGLSGNARIDVLTGSHTIQAPIHLLDSVDINVAGGASLSIDSTLGTGTQDLNKSGSGTLVTRRLLLNRLEISSGVVALSPAATLNDPANASDLTELTITAGRIDLANNLLKIDYDEGSPEQAIRMLLHTGYAGGAWNGNGIVSSVSAMEGLSIGYRDDAGSGVLSLHIALPGDANLDGAVNTLDFNLLSGSFGQGMTWDTGDFNFDGVIDSLDFTLLLANHGRVMPLGMPVVPEPSWMLPPVFSVLMIIFGGRGRKSRKNVDLGDRLN